MNLKPGFKRSLGLRPAELGIKRHPPGKKRVMVVLVPLTSFLSNSHTHQHYHIHKQKPRAENVHGMLRGNRELALTVAGEVVAHREADICTGWTLKARLLTLVSFWGQ